MLEAGAHAIGEMVDGAVGDDGDRASTRSGEIVDAVEQPVAHRHARPEPAGRQVVGEHATDAELLDGAGRIHADRRDLLVRRAALLEQARERGLVARERTVGAGDALPERVGVGVEPDHARVGDRAAHVGVLERSTTERPHFNSTRERARAREDDIALDLAETCFADSLECLGDGRHPELAQHGAVGVEPEHRSPALGPAFGERGLACAHEADEHDADGRGGVRVELDHRVRRGTHPQDHASWIAERAGKRTRAR